MNNNNQSTQAAFILEATQKALIEAAQSLAVTLGKPVSLESKGGTELGTVSITGVITNTNCWNLFPAVAVAHISVVE